MSIISVTDTAYFVAYKKMLKPSPKKIWEKFCNLSKYPDIIVARQASAVFSSRIEGVNIDLNFYINSRISKAKGIKAETRKTLEWVKALEDGYKYAEGHVLNEKNFLKVHFGISKFMDNDRERGTYRRVPIVIASQNFVVYRALPPELVERAMEVFWADIKQLLKTPLKPEQALYHASLIHLVFEKIHPFTDGNGRMGRLLEKWFLSHHCGKLAWKISSEAYYELHRPRYYAHLKALGHSFDTLNFDQCPSFLAMLPSAIQAEIEDLEDLHFPP